MSVSAGDDVPFKQAGAEWDTAGDGEGNVSLIDDARRGFEDIAAGRTFAADGAFDQLQQRRAVAAKEDC
jgi:hypothetical protein